MHEDFIGIFNYKLYTRAIETLILERLYVKCLVLQLKIRISQRIINYL